MSPSNTSAYDVNITISYFILALMAGTSKLWAHMKQFSKCTIINKNKMAAFKFPVLTVLNLLSEDRLFCVKGLTDQLKKY